LSCIGAVSTAVACCTFCCTWRAPMATEAVPNTNPLSSLMRLAGTDQIVLAQVEDHAVTVNLSGDAGVNVCHRVAGNLEREPLAGRMPVILTELVEIIDDLASTS